MSALDISKAAMPARRGHASVKDQAHPLFPVYEQYRASMANLLVDSSDFRNWLFQYESEQRNNEIAKHPRMREFQDWMANNQGGRRPCCPSKALPDGLCFPANFQFWINGGRW